MTKEDLYDFLFKIISKNDNSKELALLKLKVYGNKKINLLPFDYFVWHTFLNEKCNKNFAYFCFCYHAFLGINGTKAESSYFWSETLRYYNSVKL